MKEKNMSKANIERNNKILFLRDDESEKRTFGYIATYLVNHEFGEISEKNVRKIYHREKAKQAIVERRQK